MFCPVCESEYQGGVTKCPDDGAALVDALSTEDGGYQIRERFARTSAGLDNEVFFLLEGARYRIGHAYLAAAIFILIVMLGDQPRGTEDRMVR